MPSDLIPSSQKPLPYFSHQRVSPHTSVLLSPWAVWFAYVCLSTFTLSAASADLTGTSPVLSQESLTGTSPVLSHESLTGTSPVLSHESLTGTSPVLSQESLTGTSPVLSQESLTGTSPVLSQESLTGTSPVLSHESLTGTSPVLSQESLTGTSPVLSQESLTGTSPVLSQESPVDCCCQNCANWPNTALPKPALLCCGRRQLSQHSSVCFSQSWFFHRQTVIYQHLLSQPTQSLLSPRLQPL